MPLDALVGDDPEQAEIALAGRMGGMGAVDRPRDTLPGEQGQGDIGDLHLRLLGDAGAGIKSPSQRRLQALISVSIGRSTKMRSASATLAAAIIAAAPAVAG